MTVTLADLVEPYVGWAPILDIGAARFYQSTQFPDLYLRVIEHDDGTWQSRWACDDDVVATLGEIVDKLNVPRWSAGDDREARDD